MSSRSLVLYHLLAIALFVDSGLVAAAATAAEEEAAAAAKPDESANNNNTIVADVVNGRFEPRRATFNANVNEIFDENADRIKGMLSPMDPMKLDDLKFSIISNVYMDIHTGWMQNLSQLKRTGNCLIQYTNRIFTIDLDLGWHDLSFDYEYELKILLGSRKGDIHGQLSNLKVNIILEYNFEVNQLVLKRFDFNNSGKIKLILEGHKIDKLYNLIIKTLTDISRKSILDTVQAKVTEAIQDKIDQLNDTLGKYYGRTVTFVSQL